MALDTRLKIALRQPAIIQLDSEFVTGRMIDLLLETYVLLGFKTPVKEDVSVLAAKLVSDIYENCGFLRLEEISICFELVGNLRIVGIQNASEGRCFRLGREIGERYIRELWFLTPGRNLNLLRTGRTRTVWRLHRFELPDLS